MSIANVNTGGTLPDLVSTIIIEVLSKVKGGALDPPKVQEQVELEVASSLRSPQELQDWKL